MDDELARLRARVYGPDPTPGDVADLASRLRVVEAERLDEPEGESAPAPTPGRGPRRGLLLGGVLLVVALAASGIIALRGTDRVAEARAAARVAASAAAEREIALENLFASGGSHAPDWVYDRMPELLPRQWRTRPAPYSYTTLRLTRTLPLERAPGATQLLLVVGCHGQDRSYRWSINGTGRFGEGPCGDLVPVEICCSTDAQWSITVSVRGELPYSVSTYQR